MIQKFSNRYLVTTTKNSRLCPKRQKPGVRFQFILCAAVCSPQKSHGQSPVPAGLPLPAAGRCAVLHQPGRFDQLPADILHDLHRDAVPVIRSQQHQCPSHDAPRLIDRRLCLQITQAAVLYRTCPAMEQQGIQGFDVGIAQRFTAAKLLLHQPGVRFLRAEQLRRCMDEAARLPGALTGWMVRCSSSPVMDGSSVHNTAAWSLRAVHPAQAAPPVPVLRGSGCTA